MTISRKILAEQLRTSTGGKARPTDTQEVSAKVISGGKESTRADRGHRDLGQVIRKGQESITRSQTSIYGYTNAEFPGYHIDPGEVGSYVIRAGTANTFISLGKPPAVPANQLTKSGKARERFWQVDVLIFHAVECSVSWPENVIAGRAGYKMTDHDSDESTPEQLTEIEGPAPNPRPAGSADFFRLTYIERTGTWLVEPVVSADSFTDPIDAIEDGTEPPEVDEGGGEDGSTTPDQYTDGDGNAITPGNPYAKNEDLVAFHEGAITLSESGGLSWRRYNSPISNPSSVSYVAELGFAVPSNGRLWVSGDARAWIDLAPSWEVSAGESFEIPNGDFETGELAPWQSLTSDTPRVLASKSGPAQRPGSLHYLTRDWRIINSQDFGITQTLQIPDSFGSSFKITADVYAEEWAQAELRVDQAIPGLVNINNRTNEIEIDLGDTWQNTNLLEASGGRVVNADMTLIYTNQSQYLRNYDVGPGYIRYQASGQKTNDTRAHIFQADFKDEAGAATDLGGVIIFKDLNWHESDNTHATGLPNRREAILVPFGDDGITVASKDGAPVPSHYVDLGAGGIWTAYTPNEFEDSLKLTFSSRSSLTYGQSIQGWFERRWKYVEQNGTSSISVLDQQKGAWHTIELEIDGYRPGDELAVSVLGSGDPADVVIDNVSVDGTQFETGEVLSVASNGDHHLVGCRTRLYKHSRNGLEFIADIPSPATSLGATKGLIAAHDESSNELITSTDGGLNWKSQGQAALRDGFTPGDDRLLCIIEGSLYEIKHTGIVLLNNTHAFHDISWDTKRQAWFAVSAGGEVLTSTSLDSWSVSSSLPKHPEAENYRIFCTEFGRQFAWSHERNEVLWSDDAASWGVGDALFYPIHRMVDVI